MIEGIYPIFQEKWKNYQTFWIISDPHFNDKELAAAINRPGAQELVDNINSKVGRKDLLICLGDVCDVDCVRRLRGYKVLVMGNHDAGRTNYERVVEVIKLDKEKYTKEEAYALLTCRYPGWKIRIETSYTFWKATVDNCLFDEVYSGPITIGEKLILSHEPVDVPWAFNIHGHIHDSKHKNDKRHFNVCFDVIGYTPINMNQWMKQGYLSHIETIHRTIIDKATERKKKRDERTFNNHGQQR